MSKVLEVYRILKGKLGEEEARVVAEAFDELGGTYGKTPGFKGVNLRIRGIKNG